MKTFSIIACTTLISTSALANYVEMEVVPADSDELAPIEIVSYAFNGTGCSAETVAAELTPDKQTLSILFADFIADAGDTRLARKNCNTSLTLLVPQGLTVGLIGYDYRGFVITEDKPGSRAHYSTEYFFAGFRGPRSTKTFPRGSFEDFLIEDRLQVVAAIWSPCGRDVNLRSNTSVTAMGEGSYLSVDSLDISSAVEYQLQWRRCNEE